MKKKYIIIIFILIVGTLLIFASTSGRSISPNPTQNVGVVIDKNAPVVTVDVVGGNFYFTPKEIRVKKGDTVTINFKNVDGFHDFKIDEFNVATQRIQAGGTETVQFSADKAGSFEYYCSVGSHRAMGMKGMLIVE